MNCQPEKRLLLCWFRKNINIQNCRSFWKSRTMASDVQPGKACSNDNVNETRSKEEKVEVSKTQLFSFLNFVKFDKLSEEERLIHTAHLGSLENGDDTYKDPLTGYSVFTRLAHLRRGVCCGSACRHCPYGHKAVPTEKKTKVCNSAFYV